MPGGAYSKQSEFLTKGVAGGWAMDILSIY